MIGRSSWFGVFHPPRAFARVFALALAFVAITSSAALAAVVGKVQGKLVSTENGEPIGYADLLLIPADTTLKKVGALSNADGTFLLIAAPGRYTLQVRALSYTKKLIEGVVLEPGALQTMNMAMLPQAIEQKEVLVEARLRQNTENALLAARRKSSVVGDAVS
ncbi:MAG: carboxypeptidase regulatory-like domain-containing protein, partial [Candidatus Eisenbacteria bacterium]|nr:carboxypeptidase regulatory-like domain-containing protein [Candidatus Eisenbacteria bacterium]